MTIIPSLNMLLYYRYKLEEVELPAVKKDNNNDVSLQEENDSNFHSTDCMYYTTNHVSKGTIRGIFTIGNIVIQI